MAVVSRTQRPGTDGARPDDLTTDAARLSGARPELVVDSSADTAQLKTRALMLWPGLDRARLGATGGDPLRIARLVARRTSLPIETILAMLGVRALSARPPSHGTSGRRIRVLREDGEPRT